MLVSTRRRWFVPLAITLIAGAALALLPLTTAAQNATLVGTAEHETHGTILVDSEGMTLYTTTHAAADVDVEVWQPLTVGSAADLTVATDIVGDFDTSVGVDGLLHVTFEGQVLYTFTGDTEAGDALGHGLDDGAWSVVQAETAVEVEAQGEFSVEPIAGGLTITSYTGSLATLQADAQAFNLVSAFATVDGGFVGYTFGAPDFVNATFVAQFEAGFEAEGLIVLAQ